MVQSSELPPLNTGAHLHSALRQKRKSTVLVNAMLVMSPLHILLNRIIIIFMYHSLQSNNCYLYIMFWIHKEKVHKSHSYLI